MLQFSNMWQADVAIGIRKIRPITRVKVAAALGMYLIWHIAIPTEVRTACCDCLQAVVTLLMASHYEHPLFSF